MRRRQFCRTQNGWANWDQKSHGIVKQVDVAPCDGYGNIPYPHIFGAHCPCHPAKTENKYGVRFYVHEHPLTEAR